MVVAKYIWGVVFDANDIEKIDHETNNLEVSDIIIHKMCIAWNNEHQAKFNSMKVDFEFNTRFDDQKYNIDGGDEKYILGVVIGETDAHYTGIAIMPKENEISNEIKEHVIKFLNELYSQHPSIKNVQPGLLVFIDACK